MKPIDRELAAISYHHARAAQERMAAARAADERSRTAHLHLAVVHEVYSVLGPPAAASAQAGEPKPTREARPSRNVFGPAEAPAAA